MILTMGPGMQGDKAGDWADDPLTELAPGEEPTTTGTVFMVTVLLVIIVAIWVIMYMRLLDR